MKEFLLTAVGLSLMRLIMDLALPEGEISRYADLGAGLMMMICMLRALIRLTGGLG